LEPCGCRIFGRAATQIPIMLSRPYTVIAYHENVSWPSMDIGVCSDTEEENAMIPPDKRINGHTSSS
jgi:hypothetical protein